MDAADELSYLRLKLAKLERQEVKLHEALVRADATIPKKVRQAIMDVLVLFGPLRRYLVTLEADPDGRGFVEARELVRNATKMLDDVLDGK